MVMVIFPVLIPFTLPPTKRRSGKHNEHLVRHQLSNRTFYYVADLRHKPRVGSKNPQLRPSYSTCDGQPVRLRPDVLETVNRHSVIKRRHVIHPALTNCEAAFAGRTPA